MGDRLGLLTITYANGRHEALEDVHSPATVYHQEPYRQSGIVRHPGAVFQVIHKDGSWSMITVANVNRLQWTPNEEPTDGPL